MSTATPGVDWGNDESTFDTLGNVSMGFDRPQITGIRVPLEHCARTVMTPIGALFYDTSKGVRVPLQTILNTTLTDAELLRVTAEYGQACAAQVAGVTRAEWRFARDGTGKIVAFSASIWLLSVGVLPLSGSAGDVLPQFKFSV